MKKIRIFLVASLVFFAASIVVYMLVPRRGNDSLSQRPEGAVKSTNGAPVSCASMDCLVSNFLKCNPSELKTPFPDVGYYVVTVLGQEGDKCHYQYGVRDSLGNFVEGGFECAMPEADITTDVIDHIFHSDQVPAKTAIRTQQDKMEKIYCTAIK